MSARFPSVILKRAPSRFLPVVVVALIATGTTEAAARPVCKLAPLEDQYADADAAFVGRLLSERPDGDGGRRLYRFAVDRVLKGPLGREVDVSAPLLTDRDGTPLAHDAPVGVLASLAGASFTTTSCGLIEPGSLVSASEPQRGQPIRLVIGLVFAALVVGFALVRLRRRQRPAPRGGDGAGEPPPPATPPDQG